MNVGPKVRGLSGWFIVNVSGVWLVSGKRLWDGSVLTVSVNETEKRWVGYVILPQGWSSNDEVMCYVKVQS